VNNQLIIHLLCGTTTHLCLAIASHKQTLPEPLTSCVGNFSSTRIQCAGSLLDHLINSLSVLNNYCVTTRRQVLYA